MNETQNKRNLIEILKADKVAFRMFGISFFMIIVVFGLLLILFGQLPEYIPLYNQLPWGDMRLGGKSEFFIPLGMVLFFLLTNCAIFILIYEKMPLVGRIISITTFFLSLSMSIFTLRTLFLIL